MSRLFLSHKTLGLRGNEKFFLFCSKGNGGDSEDEKMMQVNSENSINKLVSAPSVLQYCYESYL